MRTLVFSLPLPYPAPFPLFDVGRDPWAVDMVQGNDMVLYIDSGAAIFGRSYQYPDFTFPHQIKQSLPIFPLIFASWINAICSFGIPFCISPSLI